VIGLPFERLKSYPEVIAAAGGSLKAPAIRAVVRAGSVTTLVTHSTAAWLILQSIGQVSSYATAPVAQRLEG
jgi:DNA-binding transcriptional regulator LsrR (DeoR family)